MLGSCAIGSQAVGESSVTYAPAGGGSVIVEASGRSSGTASVYASSAIIISASGRSIGKSVVIGESKQSTGGLRASSSLVFTLVPAPFTVTYSSGIKYTLTVIQ